MKKIYPIALFFLCFLDLVAQNIYVPSAEFFATGRFRSYYGQTSDFQQPPTKITYGRTLNNTFTVDKEFINAYVNCMGQKKSILSNFKLSLDSFVLVNGLLSKHLRMNRNTVNAQFVEFQRDEYYYSNSRIKPDSIITLPAVDNKKVVRTFIYDLVNRVTVETVFQDSLGRKFFNARYTKQSNVDGYTIKFITEYFFSGNWTKYFEELITWQSDKLIVHKELSFDYTATPDTLLFIPKYSGITNRVDTFYQIEKERTTGKVSPSYYRYVNVSQNAKGYPTKVLLQTLKDATTIYEPNEEWTYIYYPGDTLVRSKAIRNVVGTSTENYEYCGIPNLTPTAELQSLDFKIYPNPTNQVLNIEIPQNMAFSDIPNAFGTEGVSVEIVNAMGLVVSKTKLLNVDVSALPTGIYFVQIKTKDRVGVRRFIVNR